jgi:hypothetical protein
VLETPTEDINVLSSFFSNWFWLQFSLPPVPANQSSRLLLETKQSRFIN